MDKLPLWNAPLYLHVFGFQVKQGSHWLRWAVTSGRFNAGQVSSFFYYLFIFFKAKSAGIQRKVADSIPGHNITSRNSRIWSENDWRGRLCLCPASPFPLQWKHFINFLLLKYFMMLKSRTLITLVYYYIIFYLNISTSPLFLTKYAPIIEKKTYSFRSQVK